MEDGLFLVRESTNYPGDYTLCVCKDGKVEHYHVIYKDNKLTIDDEEYFENLVKMVEVRAATYVTHGAMFNPSAYMYFVYVVLVHSQFLFNVN
jgi:c-src tyrosine kinase